MAADADRFAHGDQFGRLTVIGLVRISVTCARLRNGKSTRFAVACRCSCGTTKHVLPYALLSGDTRSCGCLQKELIAERSAKHNARHGWYGTREYSAWSAMKQRCINRKSDKYSDYGGRGITVCEQWLDSFEQFLIDVGPSPSCEHSLGRKNNDGNYEPNNCRWETIGQQQNNRRSNHLLTCGGGATKTISAWARESGLDKSTLRNRVLKGMASR